MNMFSAMRWFLVSGGRAVALTVGGILCVVSSFKVYGYNREGEGEGGEELLLHDEAGPSVGSLCAE
jgi:hypothetical protein